MSVVCVDSLRGFRELVADLGGDPAGLLSRARIRPESLDDSTCYIPILSYVWLLEEAARLLRCSDFGMRLAARHDLATLGPMAIAVRSSENVGEALQCASRFLFTHSPAIAFTARPAERAGRLLISYELRAAPAQVAVQDSELSIASAVKLLALLSDGRHHLRAVRFAHSRLSTASVYREHFGVPVEFDSDSAAIEIDAADLAIPVSTGSRELHEVARYWLESNFPPGKAPLAVRVREVIARCLGTNRCSVGDVAAALGIHPRVLQRRLRADGCSFESIKDEVRAELAQRYLEQDDLALCCVAALLDYSEQSALTRSCHRWFGQSPRAVRARLAAGRAEPAGASPAAWPASVLQAARSAGGGEAVSAGDRRLSESGLPGPARGSGG